MKKETGLWIDHHQALIVTRLDEQEDIRQVESNIDESIQQTSPSRRRGTGGSYQDATSEVRDKKQEMALDRYYEDVRSHLEGATTLLIMGPGEAKGELKRHLTAHGMPEQIITLRSADKMTLAQIVAEVHKHFNRLHHDHGPNS